MTDAETKRRAVRIRVAGIAASILLTGGGIVAAGLTHASDRRWGGWMLGVLAVTFGVKIVAYSYMSWEMHRRTEHQTPLGYALIDMFFALALLSVALAYVSAATWTEAKRFWTETRWLLLPSSAIVVAISFLTIFTSLVAIYELRQAQRPPRVSGS